MNLEVSDEIHVKHPLKLNQSRVVTLLPCQCLMCPPSETADTSVSLINRSCLHVSIFHLFSCDRDRITSLPDPGNTLVPLKNTKVVSNLSCCHEKSLRFLACMKRLACRRVSLQGLQSLCLPACSLGTVCL